VKQASATNRLPNFKLTDTAYLLSAALSVRLEERRLPDRPSWVFAVDQRRPDMMAGRSATMC
jgi:hypothetical protein